MNKNSPTEAKFRAEAKARGFQIYHKGYPDYCLVKDNTAVFVEVKRPAMKNGRQQGFSFHLCTMMTLLTRLGIEYAVYYGNDGFWGNLKHSPLNNPLFKKRIEKKRKE